MKRLLIFDLDGTLIDTLDDLRSAVNYGLSFRGYPHRTREEVRKDIGNGVAKLMERSIPNGTKNRHYEESLKHFREYYSLHYHDNTKPYRGMKEMLLRLKEDGYLLAVATNKIQNVAEELIENNFPKIFDMIIGDKEGQRRKPEPDMVNSILEKLEVTKEETVYIGDTNVDEQTALNSKVDYLLVTYGYRTKDELDKQVQSSIRISNIDDLYQEIKKLA